MARGDTVRVRDVRLRRGGSGRLDMSAHFTTAPAFATVVVAQGR
ncbi:hypothetical protein PATSB16_04460 [Pandoraea thiooxydans]|nr:hypothetical protein PATSB16_04460 [Pandoraea thiooxydans]